MCLDPDGPHWSLSRLVSSFTTACFEFPTVDSVIGSNHRLLCRRTRSERRGRAGRPLRRGSGGSVCAAPGLPVTSFLCRCSVNPPQVVDRNLKAGVPRGGVCWGQTATAEGCCSGSTPAGRNQREDVKCHSPKKAERAHRCRLSLFNAQIPSQTPAFNRMHVPRGR